MWHSDVFALLDTGGSVAHLGTDKKAMKERSDNKHKQPICDKAQSKNI